MFRKLFPTCKLSIPEYIVSKYPYDLGQAKVLANDYALLNDHTVHAYNIDEYMAVVQHFHSDFEQYERACALVKDVADKCGVSKEGLTQAFVLTSKIKHYEKRESNTDSNKC